jgi:general stress protein CsbA
MYNLFGFIGTMSIVGFILAAIRPSLFARIKPGITRTPLLIGFGVLFLLCGFVVDATEPPQQREKQNASKSASSSPNKTPLASPKNSPVPAAKVPNYKIVHELTKKRYDGGLYEYVLIDPVSLTSGSFKTNVKAVLRDIVKKKGGKVSIETHDSPQTLDISYKQFGDMSLGRQRTTEENALMAVHYVAAYSGQLETAGSEHVLDWFPATFTSDPTVGKYVGHEDYDPAG